MIVIVLENASEKLRGQLTKWLIETKPSVFVGKASAMVREELWGMVDEHSPQGALLIYSMNNEQGFSIKMLGEPRRSVVDLDGLQLIKCKLN